MGSIPEKLVERLQTCTNFPSPPPVALKVIELAQDPNTDLRLVADTCSGDPAIAAKIMKIANSALYASRRQSTNLRQALIVLGLNATLTLALSFTLVGSLRRDPPKGFDFLGYWRRAILAATWGKLLATELNQPFAEEVFISSLLQDIGMLAVDRIAPEAYVDISPLQLDHAKLAQHETNQIGADHAALGGWLLDSWNMPDQLVRAVAHSHDVEAAGIEPERRMYVRVVAMSGQLADAWLSGGDEVTLQRMAVAGDLVDEERTSDRRPHATECRPQHDSDVEQLLLAVAERTADRRREDRWECRAHGVDRSGTQGPDRRGGDHATADAEHARQHADDQPGERGEHDDQEVGHGVGG